MHVPNCFGIGSRETPTRQEGIGAFWRVVSRRPTGCLPIASRGRGRVSAAFGSLLNHVWCLRFELGGGQLDRWESLESRHPGELFWKETDIEFAECVRFRLLFGYGSCRASVYLSCHRDEASRRKCVAGHIVELRAVCARATTGGGFVVADTD